MLLRLADERAGDEVDLGRSAGCGRPRASTGRGRSAPRRRASRRAGPRGRSSPRDPRAASTPAAAATAFPSSIRSRTRTPRSVGSSTAANARDVRQVGQRGDGVHGRVEDQLRPLRRAKVGERAGAQARVDEQLLDLLRLLVGRRPGEGPEPRLGVELVLDVRVGVADAAHERHGGDQRPVAAARAGAPRRRGRSGSSSSSRPAQRPASAAAASSSCVALVATMPRSKSGSSAGSAVANTRGGEVGLAGDPQAAVVQRLRVLVAARQHADLGHRARGAPRRGCRSRRRRRRRPARSPCLNANPLGSERCSGSPSRSRLRCSSAACRSRSASRCAGAATREVGAFVTAFSGFCVCAAVALDRPRVGRRALAVPARRPARAGRRAAPLRARACGRPGPRGRR